MKLPETGSRRMIPMLAVGILFCLVSTKVQKNRKGAEK